MANVKVLHAGGVGAHKQDEIVYDAHPGLVHIARHGVLNAADGELIAILCDDEGNPIDDIEKAELDALRAAAKELGIAGNIGAMKAETLQRKIDEAKSAKLAEEEAARKAAEEEDARKAAEEAAKNAANQ